RRLDLAGQVARRGRGVGAPLPGPDAGRGVGDRDPAVLRGGGLRVRVHYRFSGVLGAAPGGGRAAAEGVEVTSTSRIERNTAMRVMVIVKATKNSEAGKMPSEKLLADMGKFNEELGQGGHM